MYLYHPSLIPALPSPLLTSLHRDCCSIRGKGWGRGNGPSTRWLWLYPYASIVRYHHLVLNEMMHRNYKPDPRWWQFTYRGRNWKAPPITIHSLELPAEPYASPPFKEMNESKAAYDLRKVDEWLGKKPCTAEDRVRWQRGG